MTTQTTSEISRASRDRHNIAEILLKVALNTIFFSSNLLAEKNLLIVEYFLLSDKIKLETRYTTNVSLFFKWKQIPSANFFRTIFDKYNNHIL